MSEFHLKTKILEFGPLPNQEPHVCPSFNRIRGTCKAYEEVRLLGNAPFSIKELRELKIIKYNKLNDNYKISILCPNYKCKILNKLSQIFKQPIFNGIIQTKIKD
jgi:hypothetical protein